VAWARARWIVDGPRTVRRPKVCPVKSINLGISPTAGEPAGRPVLERLAVTLDPARPFLISPPFGTYLRHTRAYSVLGSYTRFPRPGRLGQVLRTVRPLGREPGGEPKGWLNRVGLRNPGWDTCPVGHHDSSWSIISLAPLETTDWDHLERWLDQRFHSPSIEINISCPNVDAHPELPDNAVLQRIIGGGATIIFKLAPVSSSVTTACYLADLGARYIHLSNTLPTPIGGISGAALREANLPLIERIARVLEGAVEIIAGGGIYSPKHLHQYHNAGASRFSLSTAWFWPPRALRVMRSYGRAPGRG